MIMQRNEFDSQDDSLLEPLETAELPGTRYRFVPQNLSSLRCRIDNAETREMLIQRKSAHDMICQDTDRAVSELHFG